VRWIVEPDLALIAQLHDGGGGEQLAVRGHAELGGPRHADAAGDTGKAEASGPDEPLAGDDSDGDARELTVGHLGVHPGLEDALGTFDVGARLRGEEGWG